MAAKMNRSELPINNNSIEEKMGGLQLEATSKLEVPANESNAPVNPSKEDSVPSNKDEEPEMGGEDVEKLVEEKKSGPQVSGSDDNNNISGNGEEVVVEEKGLVADEVAASNVDQTSGSGEESKAEDGAPITEVGEVVKAGEQHKQSSSTGVWGKMMQRMKSFINFSK